MSNKKPPASQIKRTVPLTYWVTRDDEVGGVLSPNVDVWWEQPTRSERSSNGAIAWIDTTPTGLGKRYCRASAAHVATWGHAIPDTSRECIHVETMGHAPE